MKPLPEIDWSAGVWGVKGYSDAQALTHAVQAVAEELRGLRNDLREIQEMVSVCQHGSTGLCMACVRCDDLLRPHK